MFNIIKFNNAETVDDLKPRHIYKKSGKIVLSDHYFQKTKSANDERVYNYEEMLSNSSNDVILKLSERIKKGNLKIYSNVIGFLSNFENLQSIDCNLNKLEKGHIILFNEYFGNDEDVANISEDFIFAFAVALKLFLKMEGSILSNTGIFENNHDLDFKNGDWKIEGLNSLKEGTLMFCNCDQMDVFPFELPELERLDGMFTLSSIESFDKNMPKLRGLTPRLLRYAFGLFIAALFCQDKNSLMEFLSYNNDVSELDENGFLYKNNIRVNLSFEREEEMISFVFSELCANILYDGVFIQNSQMIDYYIEYILYILMSLIIFGGFGYNQSLKEVVSDINSLEHGCFLFSTNPLKTFVGDLSNLKSGLYMFGAGNMTGMCELALENIGYIDTDKELFPRLDSTSVLYILYALPQRDRCPSSIPSFEDNYDFASMMTTEGVITIGIGCIDDEEMKDEYAKEIGFSSFNELDNEFKNKGWLVDWTYNRMSSSSYAMRRTTEQKIFTKIIRCKKEYKINNLFKNIMGFDKLELREAFQPDYQSKDGETTYKLLVSNKEIKGFGFKEFNNLEEAIEYYDIVPLEEVK